MRLGAKSPIQATASFFICFSQHPSRITCFPPPFSLSLSLSLPSSSVFLQGRKSEQRHEGPSPPHPGLSPHLIASRRPRQRPTPWSTGDTLPQTRPGQATALPPRLKSRPRRPRRDLKPSRDAHHRAQPAGRAQQLYRQGGACLRRAPAQPDGWACDRSRLRIALCLSCGSGFGDCV